MNNIGRNSDNEIMLKILDEISLESEITQRTLAGRLNIALGLVNAYIKRLAKKGYIKISKGPLNRVKYVLTRKGFTHRVSLTYNFMLSSINYLQDARTRIDRIYGKMIEAGVKDVLIWSDGEIAELSYISMRGLPLNLIGVVDDKKEENGFFGHHIFSYEDVPGLKYDAVLIASFKDEEIQRIRNLVADVSKVYSL